MGSIEEKQEEIVQTFDFLEDWEQRYEHMIDLGKSLPLIDSEFKTDDFIIKGCQSRVWMHAQLQEDRLYFTADSDAIITKGIIAILIEVFSGQKPKDILNADTSFIDKIGIREHLSPTRANGLLSMVKQMKLYAIAFQTQIPQT
ncbi:MAG: SufE family protein [Flavobacteriaceae bacterium]|nr:SufE family protein [Flavobacteriaceae bacterium]MCY4215374.1 SufE family protein [Flavobacteriaceae bacterium]